jgi:hypothetical protein
VRRKSWGATFLTSASFAAAFTICQIAFGVIPSPPDLLQPTYLPEGRTTIDGSRRGPFIDGAFRPNWSRNGPNMFSFTNQIGDYTNGTREPGDLPF